jgi:CxxC-x17-CxxC domain-containing protein
MDFQDRAIQCIDCRNEFIFTAGEQEFYERKGFKEVPKRCKPCRDARKARRSERDGQTGRNDGNNGYGGARSDDFGNRASASRPREMFDAVCASCGAPARVPFRPANGRPVYCRECYGSRQGQGSGYGGGY